MREHKIYILLTDTGTLFTRTIKLFTKKPYNHASIAFDEELKEIYSFGRKRPQNPFIGGFVRENINEGLFRHARCAVYSLSVTKNEYERMYSYIKQIEAKRHLYKYNFIGLFWVMFNKTLERDRAFFCSQFVASVLLEGKVANFGKSVSLVRPYDLLKIPNLQLVYEGILAHYPKYLAGEENPFLYYGNIAYPI